MDPEGLYIALHHYASLGEVVAYLQDDIFDPAYCPLTPVLPRMREAWYMQAHEDLLELLALGNAHARAVLRSVPDGSVAYIARSVGSRADAERLAGAREAAYMELARRAVSRPVRWGRRG